MKKLLCINNKKAMSFAELIVVLAIIALVASMALPGLKKYTGRAEMGKLAQKAYSNLEQAIDNAVLTQNSMKRWDFSTANSASFLGKYITPNLKHKASGLNTLTTFDGMVMSVDSCDGTICTLSVDVNGSKLPNTLGKDKLKFIIDKADQRVEPHPKGVVKHLIEHNWTFSETLWNCAVGTAYTDNCTY